MTGERQLAPDYTMAFVISMAPLTLVALVAIFAVWGFVPALIAGYLSDKAIARLPRR